MGLLEQTFVTTDEEYKQGAGIDKYRDKYSIRVGKMGDSKVFTKWVFPQKWDKEAKESYPGDKAFPMSVELPENPITAVFALLKWAKAICKDDNIDFADVVAKAGAVQKPKKVDEFPELEDDDIPF